MKKKETKKRGFLPIQIIISAILGFLPSFLFIAFFIQYGSPFSNYINFLLNLNSSSGAWISAIVISLFAFFIIGIIRRGETFKKIIANKPLLITIIIIFAIIFILISVQLSLYVNFALRNDVLVELSADNENIFFTDELQEDVTFKIDLAMNPFCSAQCEYEFEDLSYGGVEKNSFNLTAIGSKIITYGITNSNLADGSQELKRFEVRCKSKKTLLCFTREEESKRAILVTINYVLSEEEQTFKNISKNDIIQMKEISYSSDLKLNESAINLNLINNSFSTEIFSERIRNLTEISSELNISIENLKELWESEHFNQLGDELPEIKNQSEKFGNETEQLRQNIISDIHLYNNLTENFSNSRQILGQISQGTMTDLICEKLNQAVSNYNLAVLNFRNITILQNKKIITEGISAEVNSLYDEYLASDGTAMCVLAENINQEIFEKINIFSLTLPNITITLKEPEPVCCIDGKCEKCCEDECSAENYPVIFLHGQSINEAISIGYSFDTFSKIKENLTYEGYIDAGAIVLGSSQENSLWGKINSTMIMTGSYFFDTYKTEMGETIFSSNQEGIDTYAIRLRNLIELVKDRTNKEKVIIVAHSMGGVVTRRYIQIFGGDNVDKAILVTAPNHGVDDKVRDYCAVIGPEVSCRDLDKNSIIINHLNFDYTDRIPLYNFVGTGCNMGDETGDGVIKNSSQYLESAVNYYFTGTCNELNFEFFHEFIIDTDRHPEVYNKIYEILKNSTLQI